MEIRNNLLLEDLLALGTQNQRANTAQADNAVTANNRAQNQPRDLVSLSNQQDRQNNQFTRNPNQTFLVNERIENLENGFRRLQEFESLNGRQFTRIEEVITETDRSTRAVVQQNNSGSTTLSESIFDRQEDGSFRLTQRFTDENGETNTNIQFNVLPPDTDVALGNTPQINRTENDPFQTLRGNELDVSA